MDATREELLDTMAAVRLSRMEISDLTMELSDNGSDSELFCFRSHELVEVTKSSKDLRHSVQVVLEFHQHADRTGLDRLQPRLLQRLQHLHQQLQRARARLVADLVGDDLQQRFEACQWKIATGQSSITPTNRCGSSLPPPLPPPEAIAKSRNAAETESTLSSPLSANSSPNSKRLDVVTCYTIHCFSPLNAFKRVAESLEKLMDATREELPDTMAVVRLSGMEISDLTMELCDNGSG
ncbi:hypothetical protein SASPL_143652 [Salvia splendens]|uniref:Hs1pro-1 C-terminal domain-containing protein n=1 Tax=Salvia splendens TaxID=180675 RepID=A0A8X8WL89_SALSN|nr:hypothetical protein SASPL_143652 [Salvia splendens]